MTREKYIELALKQYDSIASLNQLDNFYDYEQEFLNILGKMGRDILEENLGSREADKRKKTLQTTIGKVVINNSHCFSTGNNGFQVSSLLQELVVYAGQLDVYEKSNEVLNKFLGVKNEYNAGT